MSHERNNQTGNPEDRTTFVMLAGSEDEARLVRLLIESLRAFGGSLGKSPVLAFLTGSAIESQALSDLEGVNARRLELGDNFPRYFFARKVYACAQAEASTGPEVRSLVWLTSTTLVVQPPQLFHLGGECDAAFRPVHHRNVGSLASEALDDFWRRVYDAVGLNDTHTTVESYVDSQTIRPYYNTHLFALDPSLGLMAKWWELFRELVTDEDYQSGPCQDQLHQIFLHQAILSALVTKHIPQDRIRMLPPEYSYPLHMHAETPEDRRAESLEELICPVYEEWFEYPATLNGLKVEEPLGAWLRKHTPSRGTVRK